MNEAIDLKEYLQIFRKRGWIIAVLVTIAVAISGILNFFVIEPVYQAELTFMVNFNQNENAQITEEDMNYGTNLVEKYKPIIKSRKVTSQIKKNLNLNMSQGEIGNAIQINSISWAERFKLDVEYIDNYNLILDIKILFMTVLKVIKKDGISQDGHVTMEKFNGNN